MKTIKFLLFLIILGFLGLLGYQNQDYFLATTALNIDLKVKSIHYTAYPLPNYAYWGICFAIAFLYMAFRGMIKTFKLGREIKQRDSKIEGLNGEIKELKTRLDVFIHDPYIKNALAKNEEGAAGDTTDETPAEETPQDSIAEDASGAGDSADGETVEEGVEETAEEKQAEEEPSEEAAAADTEAVDAEEAAPQETPEKKEG